MVPFNNQTGPIWLPSYHLTSINLQVKYKSNLIKISCYRVNDEVFADQLHWLGISKICIGLFWKMFRNPTLWILACYASTLAKAPPPLLRLPQNKLNTAPLYVIGR